MKTVKRIFLAIIIIIAIPFIVAVFVKKEYIIQRKVTINRPNPEVFSYIRHLKNQETFSKWLQLDPAMKKDFRGTDGTIGFVYAWQGNSQAGEGEQEIKSIEVNKRLEVEVRFKRPFESVAYTPFTTEPLAPNQTEVTWGMRGKNPYPMNFMNLFMDKVLGNDLEQGLSTLKEVLEKESNTAVVQTTSLP
jgi:hypothetical protein